MREATKSSHITIILKELLDGKASTSIDSKASNRNQYYRTIKYHGIELIETRVPNLTNKGTHKERRLNLTQENIKRTEDYLAKLLGKSNAVGNKL